MPSTAAAAAAAKPSSPVEPNNEGVPAQCLAIADKKVRNLEKRRAKLIQLRDSKKELNDEQKDAVSRMDHVEQMLEYSKEMQKQFKQVVDQHEKASKRSSRQERAAKRETEVQQIGRLIRLQSVLDSVTPESREDFLVGSNGACVLTEGELNSLDSLYNLSKPSRSGESDEAFSKAVDVASEHLLLVLEKSSKVFNGLTYEALYNVVDRIEKSGYLSLVKEAAEEEPAEAEAEPAYTAEPLPVESAAPVPVPAVAPEPQQPAQPPAAVFLHDSHVAPRSQPAREAEPVTQDTSPRHSEEPGDNAQGGGAWSQSDRQQRRGGRGGPRGGRGGRGGPRGGYHRGDGEGGYRGNNERRNNGNQRGGYRGGPRGGNNGRRGGGRGGGFGGNQDN